MEMKKDTKVVDGGGKATSLDTEGDQLPKATRPSSAGVVPKVPISGEDNTIQTSGGDSSSRSIATSSFFADSSDGAAAASSAPLTSSSDDSNKKNNSAALHHQGSTELPNTDVTESSYTRQGTRDNSSSTSMEDVPGRNTTSFSRSRPMTKGVDSLEQNGRENGARARGSTSSQIQKQKSNWSSFSTQSPEIVVGNNMADTARSSISSGPESRYNGGQETSTVNWGNISGLMASAQGTRPPNTRNQVPPSTVAPAGTSSMSGSPDLARALALVLQAQNQHHQPQQGYTGMEQQNRQASIFPLSANEQRRFTALQAMKNSSSSSPVPSYGTSALANSIMQCRTEQQQHRQYAGSESSTKTQDGAAGIYGGSKPPGLEQAILTLLLQGTQQRNPSQSSSQNQPTQSYQQNSSGYQHTLGNSMLGTLPGFGNQIPSRPMTNPGGSNQLPPQLAPVLEMLKNMQGPTNSRSAAQPPLHQPSQQQSSVANTEQNLLSFLRQLGMLPQQAQGIASSTTTAQATNNLGAGSGVSSYGQQQQKQVFPQSNGPNTATTISNFSQRPETVPSRPQHSGTMQDDKSKGGTSSSKRKKRESEKKKFKAADDSRRASSISDDHGKRGSDSGTPQETPSGESAGENKSMGNIVLPCGARGMPADHNFKNAYLVISSNVQHGDELQCSYKACRNSGVKFRYCSICRIPVAKRNFHQRHSHGVLIPPNHSPQKAKTTTHESAAPARQKCWSDKPQALGRKAEATSEDISSSTSNSSDKKAVRPKVHKDKNGRSHAKLNNHHCEGSNKYKSPTVGREMGSDISIDRQRRWASLLCRRPRPNDTEGMASWLLEVMTISDLTNPLNAHGTSSLTNSSTVQQRSLAPMGKQGSTAVTATPKQPAQETNGDGESTSEEALSSLTTGGGSDKESSEDNNRKQKSSRAMGDAQQNRKRSHSRSNERKRPSKDEKREQKRKKNIKKRRKKGHNYEQP